MPTTITRRKRTSRGDLGHYRRHELLTGKIVYPQQGYDGYGDLRSNRLTDFIGPDMHADWQANRAELLAFWASGDNIGAWFRIVPPWLNPPRDRDGTLPWAAQHLDADPESTRQELRALARQRRKQKSAGL